MLRFLIVLFLALAWHNPVFAQVDPEERRIADCIDRYNTDVPFRASAAANIPENPGLVVLLRALGGTSTADGLETADPNHFGTGGRLDADTLITLSRSGHTRIGITAGVSGLTYWVPNRSVAYGGELRLGIGRRRYGVPVFEPAFLRLLQPSTCRFERMDLTIDLVRWRLLGLTDLISPERPKTLVSGIGLIVPSQHISFEGWGWKWSLSLLDFRLAPSFHWGASGSLEWSLSALVLGLNAGAHFAPDLRGFATLSAGVRFEVLEGWSPGS